MKLRAAKRFLGVSRGKGIQGHFNCHWRRFIPRQLWRSQVVPSDAVQSKSYLSGIGCCCGGYRRLSMRFWYRCLEVR